MMQPKVPNALVLFDRLAAAQVVVEEAGKVRAVRVPVGAIDQARRWDRERLFDLVVKLGLEVWREGEEYVFDRPSYPPMNRDAHIKRHRWLLAS